MLSKPPLWTRTYTLLFCTNFFTWFGFSLLLSTMPLYVLHIGAKQAQIGIIIGVYPLAALLIRPFAGFTYDTLGRKKVYLVALLLFAVITYAYAGATTLLLLAIIRIFQGLFFGVATTGASTIVADIVPPERRGEGVGYFGLGNTLSQALGPALGIWIMNSYGFTTVFAASGTIMTISFIMALFVNYPKKVLQRKRLSFHNIIEKRVLSVTSLTIFVTSISGAVMTYVIVFSKELGIINGGIYFMLNATGVAFARLIAGRFLDKHGPRRVLLVGFTLLGIGLLVLSASNGIILYGLAAAILGMGNGTVMPTLQSMVISMVTPNRRGAAIATQLTALDAGISGGAIVLGWIAGLTSLATMFLICAVIVVIPIILCNAYVLKDYEKKSAQIKEQDIVIESY